MIQFVLMADTTPKPCLSAEILLKKTGRPVKKSFILLDQTLQAKGLGNFFFLHLAKLRRMLERTFKKILEEH